MIESVLSWLTPTVLFCVLNLMIATILITSTFRNNERKQQQQVEGEEQLPRTPSLLQCVRSVNLSFPDPVSSPLTASHFLHNSPSLLQCVRSINFSFSSQKPTPFPSLDQDEQPAAMKGDAENEVVRQEKRLWNRCRGRTKSFGNDEEDAIDKRADDFINKFWEQLKMQRIHSILNYKEMLNRGASI